MTGETLSANGSVSGAQRRGSLAAFGSGAMIGALGGLIGLGGAEFRLPLLIGAFRFGAPQAVILNKAMRLVVVASALPFRATASPRECRGELAGNREPARRQPAGCMRWGGMGYPHRVADALSRHRRFARGDRMCAGAWPRRCSVRRDADRSAASAGGSGRRLSHWHRRSTAR